MLSNRNTEDSNTDWKQQYLSSLNEFDAREKNWEQDKQQLLKSVLSLTFMFQGSNDLLDKKLYDLKVNLKQAGNKIPQRAIQETIAAVLQAKKDSDADKSRTSQLIRNVVELLVKDKRFSRHSEQLQHIQLELNNNRVEPIDTLKELNDIVNRIIQDLSKEQQKPDPFKVFLKRLADHEQTAPTLAAECKRALKLVNEKDMLQSINDCIELINHSTENSSANIDEAQEPAIAYLLSLLDWVTIPGKSQKKLDALKEQLEERHDPKEIGTLLKRLAFTISNAFIELQSELSETESFLKKVTHQLNEITLQIADIQQLENESFQHTETLNQEMDKQLTLLRTGVDDAESIDNIKATINKRIEILQDNMDLFIKVEQSRKSDANKNHQRLVERLGNMEQETETLRRCIEKERNKALIDALTRIPNRMAYDDKINAEYKRWKRNPSSLSLCLIDIDKFKGVNDTYGHKAGDIVLRTVAEKCAGRVRASDFFCRYGGEEFALILPDTGIEAATGVANSLREAIEGCTFQYGKQTVPITISCGLAEFKSKDSIHSAFERADKALYKAKEDGRNRCVAEHELGLRLVNE